MLLWVQHLAHSNTFSFFLSSTKYKIDWIYFITSVISTRMKNKSKKDSRFKDSMSEYGYQHHWESVKISSLAKPTSLSLQAYRSSKFQYFVCLNLDTVKKRSWCLKKPGHLEECPSFALSIAVALGRKSWLWTIVGW